MRTSDILARLSAVDVRITANGDMLQIKAPKGTMTPEIMGALRVSKAAILAHLHTETDIKALFPQSFGQSQLWFLDRLDPGNPSYNNPLALRLTGILDTTTLHAAVEDVIARHSILRTRYLDLDGEPHQIIDPPGPIDMQFHDLSQSGDMQAEKLRLAIDHESRHRFDLIKGWPLRVTVLRLAPQDHVVLVTVHHIAADGWSVGLLMSEIGTHYSARLANNPADLPKLAWQYKDHAYWQHDLKSRPDYQAQISYWKAKLAHCPDLLALPTDRPRPAEQSHRGAHLACTIHTAIAGRLQEFCRTRGTTLFAALMAVHLLVMARNSGQDTVAVGTPLSGRNRQELEPLIGHFINTVVLIGAIDPQSDFETLVARVQEDLLDAIDHQELPFEKVVEAVNPRRHPGHSPLFQNMFIFQNIPQSQPVFPGLVAETLQTDSGTAKYDLTVEVFDSAAGLQLGLEYNRDLFDPATIARLGAQYATVLAWALAHPQTRLDQVQYLEAETLLDLTRGRMTAAATPLRWATAHHAFEAQVQSNPDGAAVITSEGALTFGGLNARANRLAKALQNRGIGRGKIVAVCAERSANFVVAILAILKTGAAYLPMDTDYPAERLAFIAADSQAALVLVDAIGSEKLRPTAFADSGLICDLETACTAVDLSTEGFHSVGSLDDPAYVIYTSGSTGQPKGAVLCHRGLVNLIQWTIDSFALPNGAAVLQKTSAAFDASVWEFFWPLIAGHPMVIANRDESSDPTRLVALIDRHNVAAAQFVPSSLRLFLDTLPEGAGAGLRHVLCGGGALDAPLARYCAKALPEAALWNVYGPSETAVDATCARAAPADDDLVVPIGRPIANTRVYVLDTQMNPVPQGVVGELYIGGPGVGLGYLNATDLTARSFVCNPFQAGDTIYKTNDLVRFNNDNALVFMGRADLQIKLNGFRIEPGEVEATLIACGARSAVVMAHDNRLVAYVTGVIPAAALREALMLRLPGYLVPAQIITLEAFPLLKNGKIDRKSLPGPTPQHSSNAVNLTTPRDQTEFRLYQIWAAVLLFPNIGIRDNFFDVGGTSIAAIKIVHRIDQDFGVRLSLRQVIANPTIEMQAACLRSIDGGGEAEDDGVIHFREASGQGTLVCVHPAGGTGFCYLSLAKALPDSLGVIALQSPGLNKGEALLPDVSAMAETYLSRLGAADDGPLVLTGLSFGGLIAHEMGRRLAMSGRQVAVILLDTQGTENIADRRAIDVVDMAEFRDKLVRFNGTYPGIEDAQIDRYFRVYNHNRLTVRDYEVPNTLAQTQFIQARSDLPRSELHLTRRFWKRRALGGFSVRLVRGDHWDMLESEELKLVQKLVLAAFADLRAKSKTQPLGWIV